VFKVGIKNVQEELLTPKTNNVHDHNDNEEKKKKKKKNRHVAGFTDPNN